MPNYDPELQTHFRLWLDGEEVPFPEGSARFVQGSIEPISEAVSSRRTVNGTLRVQADPAFRKFRLTVSCTDSMLPALFGIDPTQVAVIWSPVVVRERGTTPSRTPVSGSLVAQDDWIEYRPILTGYLTSIPTLSEPEWQSDASWSLVFEESDVPDVYFVTLAGAPLATVAPGGSLSFNVGVLAATNTGLPIAYARVGGAFPPGTSLNASTGMITGTPSSAGLYTFTIRATSGGQTGEQTYNILIAAAAEPSVSFAAVALQDYESGVSVGLNLAPSVTVENSAGVPVFAVVSGSLPPGLSLSTSGVVFGTPTGTGAFAAQVRAIIATGEFDAQTIAFYAEGAPVVVEEKMLADGGTQVDFVLAGKNLRSATFPGMGIFEVTRAGYLEDGWVIAGGGGGYRHPSTSQACGGGSCGQVRRLRNPDGSRIWLNVGLYTIEIGAGGPGSSTGSQSSAFGIVAIGGGSGGGASTPPGSGGGGGAASTSTAQAGGGPFGNVPGTLENGQRGGAGRISTGSPRAGGGAGAGTAGKDGLSSGTLSSDYSNGDGGDGIQIYCRTGLAEWVAGGGAGGVGSGIATRTGGLGGGGNGGGVLGTNATSGAVNTGSGGGGASTGNAGNGGSGIVIICWER
jgi:hypothetical protein